MTQTLPRNQGLKRCIRWSEPLNTAPLVSVTKRRKHKPLRRNSVVIRNGCHLSLIARSALSVVEQQEKINHRIRPEGDETVWNDLVCGILNQTIKEDESTCASEASNVSEELVLPTEELGAMSLGQNEGQDTDDCHGKHRYCRS